MVDIRAESLFRAWNKLLRSTQNFLQESYDDTEDDRCIVDIGAELSLSADNVGEWLESDKRAFEQLSDKEIVAMALNEDQTSDSSDKLDTAESCPKVSHTTVIAAFDQ